jgi:hypothetical protein
VTFNGFALTRSGYCLHATISSVVRTDTDENGPGPGAGTGWAAGLASAPKSPASALANVSGLPFGPPFASFGPAAFGCVTLASMGGGGGGSLTTFGAFGLALAADSTLAAGVSKGVQGLPLGPNAFGKPRPN